MPFWHLLSYVVHKDASLLAFFYLFFSYYSSALEEAALGMHLSLISKAANNSCIRSGCLSLICCINDPSLP